jgi:hypothetical protein
MTYNPLGTHLWVGYLEIFKTHPWGGYPESHDPTRRVGLQPRSSIRAAAAARGENIWSTSAAGIVTQIGSGVPERFVGRKVAIYRSLQRDKSFLGLWCQTAQIPYQACLLPPEHADARDYSGSLVNAVTAYAFLEQILQRPSRYRGDRRTFGHGTCNDFSCSATQHPSPYYRS